MMGSVVKSTTCRTSAAKTASSAAMAVAVSSVANRSPAVSNRFHNTLDESDDVSPGLGASCDVSTPAGLDFLRTALHKASHLTMDDRKRCGSRSAFLLVRSAQSEGRAFHCFYRVVTRESVEF